MDRPRGDITDGKLSLLASNIAILPQVTPTFVLGLIPLTNSLNYSYSSSDECKQDFASCIQA
jgi:hypothetical protein